MPLRNLRENGNVTHDWPMSTATAPGHAPKRTQRVGQANLRAVTTTSLESWEAGLSAPKSSVVVGDARKTGLADESVDFIITSPPYWAKHDYGHDDQIGQESTPGGYVAAIMEYLEEWKRALRKTGSIFPNVGDTYRKHSLAGIPARIEYEAIEQGWRIRIRIIWALCRQSPCSYASIQGSPRLD